MPGSLPPVPQAEYDAHQEDQWSNLTRAAESRVASLAESEQQDQAAQAEAVAAHEADFQQQTDAMSARVGALAQAEQAPEADWQAESARMQARVSQFAQTETSPSQYPGDTGSAPPRAADAPSGELQDYARAAAVKAGIDPETFVRQIQQESGFRTDAYNPSGATGIAQIVRSAHPNVDPTDPRASLDYAANWMGQLTKQYGGDKAKALAAYNAGPGNVEKYGGVPPFEETQRYIKTILGAENGGDALGAASPAPSGRNAIQAPQTSTERGSRVEAVGQFEQGLAPEDAYSICGPVAALAFAQANGRNPDLGEARRLAKQVGWTSAGGMNGVQNEAKLLEQMGVSARLDTNPDFGKIAQDAEAGNPVIISTGVHYYFVNGYDKQTGQLHVGKTGEARKGGGSWMSAQQIATLDGGINGALFVDNPQSPTPSIAAEEDTSQLGPLGGPQAGYGAFDATRLAPAAGIETPSAQDARTRGNAGLPGGEMRPEYERLSRGRPQPMDVLAAVDVPNRIAFTAADAGLRGDNLGEALFQSGVTGGRQAKGADILADVGVTDPTVLAQAGKVIDAAVDYTNVIPGVTFAKKAGMVRQLIAEPLGAVVGSQIAGEVGRRIGGETGEAIGEFAGGLAGAGVAGSRYAKIAADPATTALGIVPPGVARHQPGGVAIPDDPAFHASVARTPGVEVTPEGLRIDLERWQKADQGGQQVAGGGPYYTATGATDGGAHYRRAADSPTGGPEGVTGPTILRRPILAEGATVGGGAMEKAYDAVVGPRAYDRLNSDAVALEHMWDSLGPDQRLRSVAGLLERRGGDAADAPAIISAAERHGYVSEEHLSQSVAAAVLRRAGYDSVVGFNGVGGGMGGKQLTEVVDLRESHYPTPEGGYTLRPEFAPPGVSGGSGTQPPRSSDPDLARIQGMYEAAPTAARTPIAERLDSVRRTFVRQWTDRGVDLAEFQTKAAQALGRPLRADEMASELARLNPDMAAKVRVDEGLRPILQAAGDDYPYVRDYLTAKGNLDVATALGQKVEREALAVSRTPPLTDIGPDGAPMVRSGVSERARTQPDAGPRDPARAAALGQEAAMNRAFSGGVDAAASQRAIDALERDLGPERFAKVQKLSEDVAAFNRDLLQRKLDAGLITKTQFDQWVTDYPTYTPVKITDFLRDTMNGGSGQGKSLSVRSNGIKVLSEEGTSRLREDPIASSLRNAYETEALVKRNDTFNAFVRLRDADPTFKTQIREVPNGFTAARSEQTVTGFVKGERKTYVMPADMAAVVKQEGSAPVRLIGPLLQLFKMAVTSRNPAFLAGNAINDAVSYVLRTSSREGGPQHAPAIVVDLAKAYVNAFSGLLSGEFRGDTARFLREGGGQFGFFQRSEAGAKQGVEALRRSTILSIENAGDLGRLAKDLVLLKPVETLGERIELAPRVAAFRRAERAGGNTTQAVIAGRSVTIDFAQGGSLAKVINGFVPFFNVSVQAAAVPFRAVRENPRGAALTALGLLVAPTVAAEAWNNADEQRAQDYADVPNYLKDQGVVVMLPGEAPVDDQGNRRPQFVHIKMRDYAPLIILTREVAKKVVGGESRDWASLLGGAGAAVLPVTGAAQVVLPGISTAVQLEANRDLFRGRDISTKTGDENAASLSSGVAEAINWGARNIAGKYPDVRPSQVDFAARDVGGGLANLALSASNMATGKATRGGTPQDLPGAGAFIARGVRGDIGQTAQDARDARLSQESLSALYEAGLKPDVSSVKGDIDGARLTRQEQAQYQRLANDLVEQAIFRVSSRSKWDTGSQAEKEAMLREALAAAHAKAKSQMTSEVGRSELRSRARDAADRKAG